MKTRVWAVVGAGYGDEGKGLSVDALVRYHGIGTVVRFNGGAQAGHTVSGDFGRHVFHHFCSGAFAGAQSHLSRFFVTNPVLFWEERKDLMRRKANVGLSIDPRSPVTTPLEMMVNQAVELKRGKDKHGSCGVGFGETLEREEKGPSFLFSDVLNGSVSKRLSELLDWHRCRTRTLGIEFDKLPFDLRIWDKFCQDWSDMLSVSNLREDGTLGKEARLLFEGAQGLGLDQDLGHFPFVTRSFTGLPNIWEILSEFPHVVSDIVYATRCYATRHGAGPFENEDVDLSVDFVDLTNTPNTWQDSLRVAPLDFKSRSNFIQKDLNRVHCSKKPMIFVSCLDQMYDSSQHLEKAKEISQNLNGELVGFSAGPSFEDVHFCER